MKTRNELVKDLIEFRGNINEIMQNLAKYSFDSEPLVTLTRFNIINVLESFLEKKKSALDVETWANAIEMRDDVEYESGYEKIIANILFILSDQEINGTIIQDSAKKLISQLKQ